MSTSPVVVLVAPRIVVVYLSLLGYELAGEFN
jgi:hypothetical protein